MKARFLQVFAAFLTSCPAAWVVAAPEAPDPGKLKLASAHAVVVDLENGRPLFEKQSAAVTPIASVTKLMTAMVVLDSGAPLDEPLAVNADDVDTLKGSRSRLQLGVSLPRREMLRLALMSSENRAASALARHHPGGNAAFVAAMNRKAAALGMDRSRFADPTGLSSENVSTARDLALMVHASANYPLIREFTTQESAFVEVNAAGRVVGFNNSNPLVSNDGWEIQVSKTGFIREAGKCLVMLANIASRPIAIVLLDSFGRYTRVADAVRVKHWIETGEGLPLQVAAPARPRSAVKVAAARPAGGGKATPSRAVYKQPARSSAAPVKAARTRR